MVVITILRWGYKSTYNVCGPHLVSSTKYLVTALGQKPIANSHELHWISLEFTGWQLDTGVGCSLQPLYFGRPKFDPIRQREYSGPGQSLMNGGTVDRVQINIQDYCRWIMIRSFGSAWPVVVNHSTPEICSLGRFWSFGTFPRIFRKLLHHSRIWMVGRSIVFFFSMGMM